MYFLTSLAQGPERFTESFWTSFYIIYFIGRQLLFISQDAGVAQYLGQSEPSFAPSCEFGSANGLRRLAP